MATTNPDSQPGGRLHLFGLPGELQDMIFEFAYHRPADVTLTRASVWRSQQSMQRQLETSSRPFVSRPYPGSKVSSFLVSKRYFLAAARVYASSTPLIVDKNLGRGLLSGGVLPAFARHVECSYEEIVYWRLPNLKVLRATVRLHLFGVQEERLELPVLKQKVTEAEFEGAHISRELDKFKGRLKTLELIPQDALVYRLDATQKVHWEANVKTLEAVVTRRVVTGCSDQPANTRNVQGRTPLYLDSNVSFEAPPKLESPPHSPPPPPPPKVTIPTKAKPTVKELSSLPTIPTKPNPSAEQRIPLNRAVSLLAQVSRVEDSKVQTLLPELLDKLEQIRRNGKIEPNQSPAGLTPPPTKRFVPKVLTKRSGVWMSSKEYEIIWAGLKAKAERLERERELETVNKAIKQCEAFAGGADVVVEDSTEAAARKSENGQSVEKAKMDLKPAPIADSKASKDEVSVTESAGRKACFSPKEVLCRFESEDVERGVMLAVLLIFVIGCGYMVLVVKGSEA